MSFKISTDQDVDVEVKTFVRKTDWADSAAFERASLQVQTWRAERDAEKKTKEQTNKWKAFVAKFHQDDRQNILKSNGYDINRRYTKLDVQQAAESAIDAYRKQGTKGQDRIRAAGRAFSDNASAFEVLLDFVPDGEYTFIVCGVLTLLIKASKRAKELREKVMLCLKSLTTDISRTEDWLDLYGPRYNVLWSAAENLYVVLLEVAEPLMIYISKSGANHFFHQGTYGKQIDDVKTRIDETVAALHSAIEQCLHIRLNETHENVLKSGEAVDRVELGVNDSGQKINRILVENAELKQALKLQYQAILSIQVTLKEQTSTAEWFRCHPAPDIPKLQGAQPAGLLLPANRIIALLNVPRNSAASEVDNALALGKMLNSQSQARVSTVLQNDRYRSWFHDATSQILAVNGMEHKASHFPALRYLPALLCNTLETMQAATPLTFFCERHSRSGDELEGGRGLMRSLCAQMLWSCPIAGDICLRNAHMGEAIADGDVEALCELFRILILASAQPERRAVIICMIDDIRWLEDEYSVELDFCMRSLRSLVTTLAARDGAPILKVLVTNPVYSDMGLWCSDEDIISVPDSVWDRGWCIGSSDMILDCRDDFYNESVGIDNDY